MSSIDTLISDTATAVHVSLKARGVTGIEAGVV